MNGDGVLKVFLGCVIVVLFGFMGWAVMEHYKDHDRHMQENYEQRMNSRRHDVDHQRILQSMDRHEDKADKQHDPYYCPICRRSVSRCPHYRQYDPYYRNNFR